MMLPVKKEHSNFKLLGTTPDVGDLHTSRSSKFGGLNSSVWKCPSLWKRIKFVFHGEVTLTVMGETSPPVLVVVGDVVVKRGW